MLEQNCKYDNAFFLEKFDKESCVYFLLSPELNKIKIGTTSNIKARFASLKAMLPVKLDFIYVIYGGFLEENILHNILYKCRVKGEWFCYTKEIIDYIEILKSMSSIERFARRNRI